MKTDLLRHEIATLDSFLEVKFFLYFDNGNVVYHPADVIEFTSVVDITWGTLTCNVINSD